MTFGIMTSRPFPDAPPGPQATARVHTLLTGHWSPEVQTRIVLAAAARSSAALRVDPLVGYDRLYVLKTADGRVTVQFSLEADAPPQSLEHSAPPTLRWRAAVLTAADGADGRLTDLLAEALVKELRSEGTAFSADEIRTISDSMPLLRRWSTPEPALAGWALIFRDHYVENSVGFLLAAERAGFSPHWIYALDKGDRTLNRERVHSHFLRRGYRSATLDNSVVNGTAAEEEIEAARAVGASVDGFIRAARACDRKVLIVDNGGIIALGSSDHRLFQEQPDAAVELTVSGLKRIAAAPDLDVPVFNMARSRVKTHLAYHEIADSCLRRLRAIVPGQKFVGRRVLCLGFGALGARIAAALRALGCRVTVVDTDVLTLIQAAEQGFDTCRSVREALQRTRPFLITGSTGEEALTKHDLALLPDGVLLAGFATKDFSLLSERRCAVVPFVLPGVGVRYRLPAGQHATLLGDGRPLNLFGYEGIPNRGYDAYRAATLIAVKQLCRSVADHGRGLHLAPVDEAIEKSGLYQAYYDTYLAEPAVAAGDRAHG